MRFTSTAAIGFWMRPTIVTSASVMTPLAGLSWARTGAVNANQTPTANNVVLCTRIIGGFTISASLATSFRRRRRRRFRRCSGGRRVDRFLGARLRLYIGLFLLRAVQKLLGVVA